MKIENEILQTSFKSEHHKLLINIIFTNNFLSAKNKCFFDEKDITAQQYNILRILRGSQQGLSTLQIRERMLDKMSDTSRLVDRLCIKALVMKDAHKTDRRLVSITITAKGLQLLKQMDDDEEKLISVMYGVTQKEAIQLNNLLDKLRDVK